MRWRVLTAGFAAALAVAGCGDEGGGGAAGDAAASPGIRGVLRDEKGAALADTEVLACQTTICQFGVTDGRGAFVFPIDAPAKVAIKTREDLAAVPPRGSALYPVQLGPATSVDLHDVHVPTLPHVVPLAEDDGAQTIAAGDGLELTLRRRDLVSSGHALTGVGARAIGSDRMPDLLGLGAEEVVACYALHPFGVTSTSPIAVSARTTIPPGVAVKLRTISDIDGTLSEPVPGTSDGRFITTPPGTGIASLTWLVITR